MPGVTGLWIASADPTLRRGDIVVMENRSAHKVDGVAAAIAARDARLIYLPPHSPRPVRRICLELP